MKVMMMLCDHCAESGGKLYINGGGWTHTGPPSSFGIALYIEVPWDRTSEPHRFRLMLLDLDGEPVMVESPEGEEVPLEASGEFETGRPPGLRPGSPVAVPIAINFSPPPLDPDETYEWRLEIDGDLRDEWRLGFSTRRGWTT